MTTKTPATEGQAKIRKYVDALLRSFSNYENGVGIKVDELRERVNAIKSILDASPPIVGDPVSSPTPSVIEAGDAMENMMRRLRTQRDDEGILPTGNDFNGMDGLCAAWVAAKASRPSVTAPQGVTVDQILEVVNDWRANMHLIEVPPNTPYSTGVQNVLRSRLSALLTNPK